MRMSVSIDRTLYFCKTNCLSALSFRLRVETSLRSYSLTFDFTITFADVH